MLLTQEKQTWIRRNIMAKIVIDKKVVRTDRASAPLGPYSQGIIANGFVFVAGEKGVDPKTGKIVPGGIEPETRQTLENIKAILEAAGSSFDLAVSAVVHMTNLDDFATMNKIFAEYFRMDPPGRTTVEVKRLPAGAHVEITVTSVVKI
jgi:2-iminobutanoate/2-iminopropanoate deaminase